MKIAIGIGISVICYIVYSVLYGVILSFCPKSVVYIFRLLFFPVRMVALPTAFLISFFTPKDK